MQFVAARARVTDRPLCAGRGVLRVTHDAFHFMSQPLAANGEVVARVLSIQNSNAYAKAGVMIRGALTAGSAHVLLDVKPGGGVEFMSRNVNGGSTVFIAGVTVAVPVWLRLKRDAAGFDRCDNLLAFGCGCRDGLFGQNVLAGRS